MPNHKTALDLIRSTDRPIAAPSANLFNHVSPTTSKHVFNDFFDKDVTILDDGRTTLGIESTVIKVEDDKLIFFRLGSLPLKIVKDHLDSEGIVDLEYVKPMNIKKEDQSQTSPGQFLKHYSPNIESYILGGKGDKIDIDKDDVIIDFKGQNLQYKEQVSCYMDLSSSGCFQEAMLNLYFMLR